MASERRTFTIAKFGRHTEGYFHARVAIGGRAFYTHRKSGSWLVPGTVGSREVLKEWVDRDILEALAAKARAWEKAERAKAEQEGEGTQDGSKGKTQG